MPPKRRMKMAYQGTAKRYSARLQAQMRGKAVPSTSSKPLELSGSDSDSDRTPPLSANMETPKPVEPPLLEEPPVDKTDSDSSDSDTRASVGKGSDTESNFDSEEAEDNLRFRNRATELKFENNYSKRPVICERGIKLEDYSDPPFELRTLFEERGWLKWVTARRVAIVPLVREFYANGQVWRDEGKRIISAKVRGVDIEVDVKKIAELGYLPSEEPTKGSKRQRQLWKEQLSKENLGRLLSGKSQVNWKRALLSKSELTPKSNVLHMLVCSSMMPQAFRSSVSLKQATLIGRMLLNIPFNLANHVWCTIAWEVENPEHTSGLPFGGLITDIILKAGVQEEAGMERVKPMSLIAATSVKRSRGQLGKKNEAVASENVQQPEVREEPASTSKTLEERVIEIQKDQEILKNEVRELKAGQQRLIDMMKGIYDAVQAGPEKD